MQTPKAIIYTRVSTGRQAEEGTSLETQEAACLNKAREMGAQVVDIISDEGVSGALYLSRPGIQKALAAIEAHQADTLITLKLDRTGRDVDVIRVIQKRVSEAGGSLVFADGMNFENNATGRLMLTQLAGFAEFEREVIRERTMKGARKRAEEGKQPIRNPPFGYHIITKADVIRGTHPAGSEGTYIVNEERARWIREAYRRYAAGASLRDIVRLFNENGVPTRRGGEAWTRGTIHAILTNPVYKGCPTYGRQTRKSDETDAKARGLKTPYFLIDSPAENVIQLSAPVLVNVETWDVVQERLTENKQLLSGPGTERRYMLSGLLRCPKCGLAMTGKGNTSAPRRYYLCRSANVWASPGFPVCDTKHYPLDKTDAAIINAMLRTSQAPELFKEAVEAYEQRRKEQSQTGDAEEALQADLKRLAAREQATARAQVDALVQGRSTEIYDRLLQEIHIQRQMLTARLMEAKAKARHMVTFDARTAVQKYTEIVSKFAAVLTDPDITPAEKHSLLSMPIKKIVPDGEGFRIETVYNISP